MMNDPVKRRRLLKAAGGEAPVKEKEHSHRKHRHRHHRHREHDRHDQDDEERLHRRSQKRRRSEYERRKDRDEAQHTIRRSASSSYSRSPSPYRRRSPSPYYRPRRASPQRRRSRSPQNPRDDGYLLKHSKSWSTSVRKESFPSNQHSQQHSVSEDRAAKLLAMQKAASELDEDREKRISALNTREVAEKEAEDAARARTAKYGGKGDFVNGLHRKVGDMDIAERMRRGRGGLERERDEL